MAKKIQKITGILKYNDNGEYEICNASKSFNLSKLLSTIYYSPKSHYINLCIMDGCKVIFNEEGGLYKARDDCGIYSYFILGEDLENVIFNNTNRVLEFSIFTDALGEKSYGQFFTE